MCTFMIDSRVLIGEIGEQLVNEYYDRAVRSNDWFDSKKDGMIDNLTYEVKCLRKNFKTNGFWIPQNQFKKLDSVDLLYFIKVPEQESDGLGLYLCTNHLTNFESFSWKGKSMRNYPFTKCMLLDIIHDERVKKVLEHSMTISTYKRNV